MVAVERVPAPGAPPARRHACVLVLGTVAALAAPHLGVPMVLYPLLGLGLCNAMLHWQRLRWADVGFRWRALGPRPLLIGAVLGVLYAAVNFALIGPVLAGLLEARPDLSDFAFVRASLAGYLLAVAMAWVIGGLYEELVFRGFLHGMLLRWLLARRAASFVATASTVLAFAAYHGQLGRFGVANALVFALFAAAVRRRWPANLWYVVSFHACADTGAFTLMRLGWL